MSSNEPGTGSSAARWLTIHDELLRGISHALSNRIATVGAASYMIEHGDIAVQQAVESLRSETERMDQLLQQLRLLPERIGAAAEPITADDACNSAIRLHAHHGELRDIACNVTVDPDVYPVWAEPHALCHALLVALTTAKRNSANGAAVTITVSGDSNIVRFSAVAPEHTSDADVLNEADARAAAWLLAPNGGNARSLDHGCELELPTLLAVRRARKG